MGIDPTRGEPGFEIEEWELKGAGAEEVHPRRPANRSARSRLLNRSPQLGRAELAVGAERADRVRIAASDQ
jgi:hypothetical protein